MFGPTIQGEGPSQGRAVIFLRLGLCNLDCSWCDTPYTWDWTGKNGTVYIKQNELTRTTVEDIHESLLGLTSNIPARLVISGGEPLIQQKSLVELIRGWDAPVEIETNGTIQPSEEMLQTGVQFNCSPKLSNSGINYQTRIVPNVLWSIRDAGGTFKFVVKDEKDLQEVNLVVDDILRVDKSKIYLMPEGIQQDTIVDRLAWVMDQAAQQGYSVSPRLHVIAYGNERLK
jgi:7-cyano-7-deazaguanosine (preQ0) biosynthesis protein QueE